MEYGGQHIGDDDSSGEPARVYRNKLSDLAERDARTETAHLEFLLHRYIGDYLYHDVVRPVVNENLRKAASDGTVTYELTAENMPKSIKQSPTVSNLKSKNSLPSIFKAKLIRIVIKAAKAHSFTVNGLDDLKIYLPWSRTFEVVVEYKLATTKN